MKTLIVFALLTSAAFAQQPSGMPPAPSQQPPVASPSVSAGVPAQGQSQSASPLNRSGAPQARSSQEQTAQAQQPAANAAPAARPEDVKSIDAIMAAVYDVISGPAGQKRDWERFRSLFAPGARLIPLRKLPDGKWMPRALSPDEYVSRASTFFDKEGFFERESARKMEQYDNLVHVWSTYESRHAKEDKQPFERGINSFQLAFDGQRWWVVTIYWMGETPDKPIPQEYLRSRAVVPDESSAIAIAAPVLNRIYGEKQMQQEQPLTAKLVKVWSVSGTLACYPNCVGGTAYAFISQEGEILRTGHSK